MAYTNTTSNLLLTWPLANNQQGVAKPSGVAWDNSPWVRIFPGTDVPILTNVNFNAIRG